MYVTQLNKLGFIGELAQTQSIVLRRFFKSGRPRGVSAKMAFFFLHIGNLLNIAKLRFCLQNVLVKAQASFVGVPLKLYKPTDYTHTMFSFVPLVAKEKASNKS